MSKTNLPYRFREEAFRRYETYITSIALGYPTVQVFSPDNVETFSCRLRDAMKSLIENKWPFEHAPLFAKIYPKLRVAIRGSKVIAGSKEEIQAWDQAIRSDASAPQPGPIPQSSQVVITNPDDKALESLFHLHHQRLLTTPTRIHFDDGASFAARIPYWEENYDVHIEAQGQNTFIVL